MKAQKGELKFVNYTSMSEENLTEILKYRNSPEVRKWMLDTSEISVKDHFSFIDRLKDYSDRVYFGVYKKDKLIGGVYAVDIDSSRENCIWGFYLSPRMIGTGVGLEVEFEFLKILFEELGMKRVSGFVHESNRDSLEIQDLFGFDTLSQNDTYIKIALNRTNWLSLVRDYKTFKKNILKWKKN